MVVPAASPLSRTELDKLEEFVKGMGSKGLARAKVGEGGEWTQSPLAKTITPELRQAINAAVGAKTGDMVFFQFGKESVVHTVMANLRVHLGKKLGLIPEYGSGGNWNFLWVVNPPLFEYDEESKQWAAAHHAFTRPHDEDLEYLETDPGKVYCYRYDCVLNGFEIGGGSIRLHDPDVQARVFKAMGISDEEAKQQVRLPPRRAQDGRAPARRHRARHGPARHAPHRRRVAPRRGGLAQDPEGDGSDDRRPGGRGRQAAPRAVREEHGREQVAGSLPSPYRVRLPG